MDTLPSEIIDERAILKLANKLSAALDERNMGALTECFTSDALMKSELYEVRGHAAIIALNDTMWETVGELQHVLSNCEVSVTGDAATMRSNVVGTHVARGAPERIFFIGAVYCDRLVRTQAGWRIAERRTHIVWTKGDITVIGGAAQSPPIHTTDVKSMQV
ncbi:MAG: nuclear transport factor 2 family protein [Caulobacterales bacterium]